MSRRKRSPEDHSPAAAEAAERQALEGAARLFRALGDAPRLQILRMLARREWCVTELVAALGEKFPTVSQRLRTLRAERLIARRRDGTHIYYALADGHILELLNNGIAHAAESDAPRRTATSTRTSNRKEGKK